MFERSINFLERDFAADARSDVIFNTAKSPSLDAEVSFLTGVASNGKLVTPTFWTWWEDYPATYHTDYSWAGKWGTETGDTSLAGTSGGTVKYYFDPKVNWNSLDSTAQTAVKDCFALWSAVANIKFVQTTSAAKAQITIGESTGVVGEGGSHGDGAEPIGSTNIQRYTSGIATFTIGPSYGNLDQAYSFVFHELGHALGLGHSGPYNGYENLTASEQYSKYDTQLWTVMSYFFAAESAIYPQPKNVDWSHSDTPMIADIMAVQRLYGAPTSTPLSGGQIFGFHTNITGSLAKFFDFTVNTDPVVTLWDGGGKNTLDLSGFSTASKVNLHPGSFSSADGHVDNIAIAYGTAIDSAVGGAGNDAFVCNNDGDRVDAGGGADHLTAGTGRDVFVYKSAGESTGTHYDTLTAMDFNSQDRFDLSFKLLGVDAKITKGALSTATFDTNLAAVVNSSHLAAHHAVLFTPNSGTLRGEIFLVVDANGHAGYQAGHDLVFHLDAASNLSNLDTGDFI